MEPRVRSREFLLTSFGVGLELDHMPSRDLDWLPLDGFQVVNKGLSYAPDACVVESVAATGT